MCKSCSLSGTCFNFSARIKEFFNTMLADGINSKDCRGWTPLHHAIHMKLPNLAKQLLEFGADPKIRTEEGHTPLEFAVKSKQYNLVKLSLKLLDPNETKTILPDLGSSIVILLDFGLSIVCCDDFKMIKIFLEHGIDPDENWMTSAILFDQQEWIKLFFHYGFEADKILNQLGKTGLEVALQMRRAEIVKLFVQYGASLRVRNGDGYTAFEQTCQLIADGQKKYMTMLKQVVYLDSNK